MRGDMLNAGCDKFEAEVNEKVTISHILDGIIGNPDLKRLLAE